MGLLLSLGAICSQGSDIGVTPVYKNKKRRAYWLKETRLRTWRGKERTWLLWKGPCRGHREEYLYDVPWPGCIPAAYIPTSSSPRAECVQCIVLPPGPVSPASFNEITPRDRDGINTAAALFSYAHILRCALLGNSPSQSPPTSLLFLVLPSPILLGSLPYLVPSADYQPRECARRAVLHSLRC
jgi:hypothetical protein